MLCTDTVHKVAAAVAGAVLVVAVCRFLVDVHIAAEVAAHDSHLVAETSVVGQAADSSVGIDVLVDEAELKMDEGYMLVEKIGYSERYTGGNTVEFEMSLQHGAAA